MIKAARIPTPPPRGVGTVWELRSLGVSRRCSRKAMPAMSQAPAAPKPAQAKKSSGVRYSATSSTNRTNSDVRSFIMDNRSLINRPPAASRPPSPASPTPDRTGGQNRARAQKRRPSTATSSVYLSTVARTMGDRKPNTRAPSSRIPANRRVVLTGSVRRGGQRPRASQRIPMIASMVWISPSVTLKIRPAASGWTAASTAARPTSLSYTRVRRLLPGPMGTKRPRARAMRRRR